MANRDSVNLNRNSRRDNTFDPQSKYNADAPRRRDSNADELIVALAEAYENRRARQVVEWEDLAHRRANRAIL